MWDSTSVQKFTKVNIDLGYGLTHSNLLHFVWLRKVKKICKEIKRVKWDDFLVVCFKKNYTLLAIENDRNVKISDGSRNLE